MYLLWIESAEYIWLNNVHLKLNEPFNLTSLHQPKTSSPNLNGSVTHYCQEMAKPPKRQNYRPHDIFRVWNKANVKGIREDIAVYFFFCELICSANEQTKLRRVSLTDISCDKKKVLVQFLHVSKHCIISCPLSRLSQTKFDS